MTAGDLVKVTRASIGVPDGTMGLILSSYDVRGDYDTAPGEKIHMLQLIGTRKVLAEGGHRRRYLARDLEVISESR